MCMYKIGISWYIYVVYLGRSMCTSVYVQSLRQCEGRVCLRAKKTERERLRPRESDRQRERMYKRDHTVWCAHRQIYM